ncbi:MULTISPECIES: hypothetical protein [Bacillus]|uniref:hypothetical protein n=1 Tax=Bacillus TaxID=1386 RepID=UPI000BB770B6|nr:MULTISPECIES: hypothetical protein [Bacillus]
MPDKKPFNDALGHLKGIGAAPAKVDLAKLPKPIRFIGYFIISFIFLSIILLLVGLYLNG